MIITNLLTDPHKHSEKNLQVQTRKLSWVTGRKTESTDLISADIAIAATYILLNELRLLLFRVQPATALRWILKVCNVTSGQSFWLG